MGLEIFTLRERPDLRPLIFASELDSVWPEFMRHDPVAQLYFAPSILDHYLDYAFAGVAGGKVVARAFSVPFAFHIDGRAELPDGGWDEVIRWAHDDRMTGRAPNALSALEISLLPEARGGGNSRALLDAMKACAKANGFAEMFAPVRPNQKHLPSADADARVCRYDGRRQFSRQLLAANPFSRRGKTCEDCAIFHDHRRQVAEWSRWTGMSFDRSGEVAIAGALVPVTVSLEHDYAVYVEPNVWVRYAL